MSIQSRSHQYGTVFENWQILELLGQGSGGKTAVFRLKRIDSNRGQSALKVINLIEERGDYDSMPAHLKKEYEAARDDCKGSALQEVWLMDDFQGNTNIVDYLDHKFVDWTDDAGFGCDMLIRMELLKDLRSEIRSGKLYSEEDVIKIGCDICQALILCHGNDILHRDIKPENIFVNRNGNYKLGDFGISRIISNAPMSMASTGIGTPEYAAPEQTSGKYDKRVDIYSLGLVLYELSNQYHLPFAKSSYVRPDDVNMRMAGVPIPPPTKASKELAAVILKACAHKADDRYQTAHELLTALSALHRSSLVQLPLVDTQSHDNRSISNAAVTNPFSTEPALADNKGNQVSSAQVAHARNRVGFETVPAVGEARATVPSEYQTIPAASTATHNPTPTYETAPAIGDDRSSKNVKPAHVSSRRSSNQVASENGAHYSKDGFEIHGATIKRYTGTDSVVTIPYFSGVDSIGEKAFAGNTHITKVVLPESVKYIKKEAFARCTQLAEVDFGRGLYRIEERAFAECRSLRELVLPDTLHWIEDFAFQDCMGLTNVNLPDGTYSMEATAFSGCARVEAVVVSRGMLSSVRDMFRGSVKITSKDDPSKPLPSHVASDKTIPHYGRVVKPDVGPDKVKYGAVETDYRKMMDVPRGTYQNESVVTDPKGRERVLNHVAWINFKGSQYAVMAQDTGLDSCMYFIFVVKNNQYGNAQFVTDPRRASAVFEEFKTQFADKTEFKAGRYSFAKSAPAVQVEKASGYLSCDYKQMRSLPSNLFGFPITLTAPNNASFTFEKQDTVVVNGIDYLIVSQPAGAKKNAFFVFKNPPGTANPPIFISEGKALRRAYRSFQERNSSKFDFEDLLEFSLPAVKKGKDSAKHFAQSSAVHQYKDHASIPLSIEIAPKYQIIDSFAFRQVCKGKKNVKEIIIPRTVQKIEANAFAGLVIEDAITIPMSVSAIGENAFTLGERGKVNCEAGSYAYSYCVKNGIRNVVDIQRYKESGVCQHCGSPFKGIFIKRCSNPNCGKSKDY